MKKITFICGLILVLFLIGCATEKQTSTSDKLMSVDKSNTVEKNTENKVVEKKETVTVDWGKAAEQITKDKEVAKLISTSKEITNYQYLFQPRIKDTFGNYGGTVHQVYIKGLKAKKVYTSPIKFNDSDFYTAVYLDEDKKTAMGYCDSKSVLCSGLEEKKYVLNYDKEKLIKKPWSLIQNIDARAKPTTQVVIENKKATVLEYVDGNKRIVRMSVGIFYGLPLVYEVYSVKGEEEVLEEKYSFGSLIVNQVLTKDVVKN